MFPSRKKAVAAYTAVSSSTGRMSLRSMGWRGRVRVMRVRLERSSAMAIHSRLWGRGRRHSQ